MLLSITVLVALAVIAGLVRAHAAVARTTGDPLAALAVLDGDGATGATHRQDRPEAPASQASHVVTHPAVGRRRRAEPGGRRTSTTDLAHGA